MSFVLSPISMYPEDLLDGLGAVPGERRWWAAYTRVRQEKRLAADLARRKVPFYLPLVERRHLYRGRRQDSQIPLFGSYVFLYANSAEYLQSLNTNRIAQMLQIADGHELYHDLVQIRRLIESKIPLTIEARLKPGQRVRVKHGSFAGLEGIVESRCRQTRLVIGVMFLQQGISIEIDDYMLEPLDNSVSACAP